LAGSAAFPIWPLSFDLLKQLAPVAGSALGPSVMVVSPSLAEIEKWERVIKLSGTKVD
jgi:hypothetical protein